MRKTIYLFFISFFWGCLMEDTPEELPPVEKQLGGLALLFEQKLEARVLNYSEELEEVANPLAPLVEHVRVGNSPVYGGRYFIVPLQNKRGKIEAGLVYPLAGSDTVSVLSLTGDLGDPLLLDKAALDAVPATHRFLLSNKFLSWKKAGLSVVPGLYAYAESLDGKSIFTPASAGNFSTSRASTGTRSSLTSVEEYPYEAIVIINYELEPTGDVDENGGLIISTLTMEAIRNVFLGAFGVLNFVDSWETCEITSIGGDHVYLEMTVRDYGVVESAVWLLMNEAASRFQEDHETGPLSYSYHYTLMERDESSPGGDNGGTEVGEGVGGGNVGGGDDGDNNEEENEEPENPTSPVIKDSVELMDASKYVGYIKNVRDCMANAKAILDNYGINNYGSSDKVYKLMHESNGILVNYGDNAEQNYQNAINCIDRHLDAGGPIIVGVNHTLKKGINEKTTDHFVVITGRGYDESASAYYYTYIETARDPAKAAEACDIQKNRIYYTSPPPLLQDNKSYLGENPKKYQITQVRPNDGNTTGTINSYQQ